MARSARIAKMRVAGWRRDIRNARIAIGFAAAVSILGALFLGSVLDETEWLAVEDPENYAAMHEALRRAVWISWGSAALFAGALAFSGKRPLLATRVAFYVYAGSCLVAAILSPLSLLSWGTAVNVFVILALAGGVAASKQYERHRREAEELVRATARAFGEG